MDKQYYLNCIDDAITLYWHTLSKADGMRLVSEDIDYVISEDRNSPERIFNIRLTPENSEERINEIIAFIKAGLIPDSFLITPNSTPPNLSDILAEKGFTIDQSGLCMAMDLREVSGDENYSDNIKVMEVKDKDQLIHWDNIINHALFDHEIMTFEQFYDIFCLPNTRFYLAFFDGFPASACLTISEGNLADLDMVATLKQYRNRGLATTIINKAMDDLYNCGVKTVSLRAEPDGINLYKRIGFQEFCYRVVASCDWGKIFKNSCPYRIERDKVLQAKSIYQASTDINDFIDQMQKQGVIGRKIWYNQDENAIYITKMFAIDCDSGCPDNHTLIGQRCHCPFFHQKNETIPITYCTCAAEFFRPMFEPLFGEKIIIEPVETVLSGGEKCSFVIRELAPKLKEQVI